MIPFADELRLMSRTLPLYLSAMAEPMMGSDYFNMPPARREHKAGHYQSCRKSNAKAKRRAQKQGRKATR